MTRGALRYLPSHASLALTALLLGATACGGGDDSDDDYTPIALTAIATGYYSSCGLDPQGVAWCWGDGTSGQLGFETDVSCTGVPGEQPCAATPGRVATSLTFSSITVGGVHACALSGVQAWCWGGDEFGQLGDGSASGACGINAVPCARVPVRVLLEAKLISAGDSHTCALIEDGRAFCWGYGSAGRLGNGASDNMQAPTPVAGDLRFIDIAAGGAHTCAIDTDGIAWCWGYNHLGQLGDGTTTLRNVPTAVVSSRRFTSISVGTAATCATAVDAETWCWGIAEPEGAARANAVCETTVPCATVPQVASLRQFTATATGESYACGVEAGGSFCWGYLPWREASEMVPEAFGASGMSPNDPFTSMSLTSGGGCGVTASNAAYCWGSDYNGRRGDGPGIELDTNLPQRVVIPREQM